MTEHEKEALLNNALNRKECGYSTLGYELSCDDVIKLLIEIDNLKNDVLMLSNRENQNE